MPIRQKQYPIRFTPRGLVDSFDATDKFSGACLSLSNLIFDHSNPEIMISRPGVGAAITSFAGFSSPGIVSVQITVGNVTYGMIASALNANKDEPFAWDNNASAFIPITGVTNANSPTTQASSGAWVPPTMASIGVFIIVTHPGFSGGATKFGVIDLTNPAVPVWSATDTATNNLPSVPLAVANFKNRAYFACTNSTPYSDVLAPLTRTNASQSLTIGDQSNITALSGLPIQTTSGGIIAALIIWKEFQTWQVTGDAATSDLVLNFMSLTVGTPAPRSVAQSPLGTYFFSIGGPYIIDQFGILRALTHSLRETEPDIKAPWENATQASRIAGGYSNGIYRISMATVVRGNAVTNDYWFDEQRRRWNGPHTFNYDCASQLGKTFVLASNSFPGQLFKSEVVPSAASAYNDAGTSVMVTLQSSTFPKTGHMTAKQVVESTIELASASQPATFSLTGVDDQNNTLNSVNVSLLPVGAQWGSAIWGAFNWASSINIPHVYTVPWSAPLVFKKMALLATATAAAALTIGTFFARYQDLGYVNTPPPV